MIVVIIIGAAAFAYLRFVKPAPQGPTGTTQAVGTAEAPASAVSLGADAAKIMAAIAPNATPAASTRAPAASGPAAPPASEPGANVAAVPVPVQAATSASTPVTGTLPAPPVDHTLQVAADLVHKGERAYANGDYESAVHHAKSALDVHPGYADAERLLRRSYAAQKRISEQQQREQQQAAEARAREQQAQAAAAAAAAAAAKPTPDQIYNDRAHSECARGFFGKSCRHKIRVAVCQGADPNAAGASVCKSLDD